MFVPTLCCTPQVWKAILTDRIDFNAPELKAISAPARELLRGLLDRDPRKRLKPSEALKHPWIQVWKGLLGNNGCDQVIGEA